MVGTILHVVNVERDRGSSRGAKVFWIHLTAYLFGAALTGFLLGGIGSILRSLWGNEFQVWGAVAVTGVVGLLYSLREVGLVKVPAPNTFRQVPAKWRLTMPAEKAALLYGLELGAGLTTHVATTTFYVVALWAVLVSSPLLGALGMIAFGIGRAIPIYLIGRLPSNTNERVRLASMLGRWTPLVHLFNGLILGFTSACFLAGGLATR